MASIEVCNLSYKIEHKKIIDDVNLFIKEKKFVGIIGPNGCGKSTLLKNIYRVYRPTNGAVYLNNKKINTITGKNISKEMAIVFQENNYDFDFTVKEIVYMARQVHKKILEDNNSEDEEIVVDSLRKVGMENFLDRSFLSLSGGEKQRVLVARALSQCANLVILDEPTNHLDIKYQLEIMNILKAQNITVFAAIHDFNMACMYCDYLYIMKEGTIKYLGTPNEVLNESIIKEIFNVNSYIFKNPITGKKQISFY